MELLPYLYAFLVGGAFCAAAQLLLDLTALTPARVLVIYVVLGVALGAVGLYEPLYRFAGAGASVPLVGFGAAVGRGVKEAVDADGLIGVLTGGLTATAAGISAALFLGFLCSLLVKARHKKM